MSWPTKVEDIAKAVFSRDVRKNLAITFSGFFYGALKIELVGSPEPNTFTTMKRPGVALIHLSFPMAVKAAGYQPGETKIGKAADRAAALIKRAFLAFGYHEIGHLKLTDMSGDLFKALLDSGKPSWLVKFAQTVANIIEDPTQEEMLGKLTYYSFVKRYFKWMVRQLFVPQAQAYADDGSLGSFLQYLLLFVRVGGRRIAGDNAQFDALAKKGLIRKLRDARREPDGVKRCQKQIDIALWIADELNIQQPAADQATSGAPERPVIILIDPTSKGKETMKQKPQSGPLPPISIAEAGEGGAGGGETPDADIIDMRKKKPQEGGGQGESQSGPSEAKNQSEGEGENGPSESQSQSQGEGQSEGESGSEGQNGSQGEGQSEGEDGGEVGGESQGGGGGQGAGTGEGSQAQGGQPREEGPLEIGGEDPLEIDAGDFGDSCVEYDPDLEAAKQMGKAAPVYADDEFEVIDPLRLNMVHASSLNAYSEEILELSESISEMKAESAPKVYSRLDEGDDIDIDAFIEIKHSPYPSLDFFQEERKGKPITDLAVSVLVDCSGSMAWGDKDSCAYATATMVVAACGDNQVPTEIELFSDSNVLYLKRFDEDPEVAAERLGLIKHSLCDCYDGYAGMWNGTKLSEALKVVLSKLEVHEGSAFKILFVITDGDTDNNDAVRELIEHAKDCGVIVVAIGIGVSINSLRQCFGECAAFDQSSLRRLPQYVSDILQQALSEKDMWLNR